MSPEPMSSVGVADIDMNLAIDESNDFIDYSNLQTVQMYPISISQHTITIPHYSSLTNSLVIGDGTKGTDNIFDDKNILFSKCEHVIFIMDNKAFK